MIRHEARTRVRYAETDQMGVVYYANYLVWMELGRAELCRAMGAPYRDIEIESGLLLAVAEAQCRYLSPARYDDEVIVDTSIAYANRRMVHFTYQIRCEGGATLARGFTKHVFVGRDMKPASLPEKYYAYFGIRPPAII